MLRYEDVDRPRPGPGEVLVQVAGTAFNPVDIGFRVGALHQIYPMTFPQTIGLDLAGTVVEQGEGVEMPAVGDTVIGFMPMAGRARQPSLSLPPRLFWCRHRATLLSQTPPRFPSPR